LVDKHYFENPLLIAELYSLIKKGKKEHKEQAIWILVNLAQLEIKIKPEKAKEIIDLLLSDLQVFSGSTNYLKGALRCIGNFLADSKNVFYTEYIASNKNLYSAIETLIKSTNMKKECIWILSLLSADPLYCQAVGEYDSIIDFLILQLKENIDYQTRKEALLTIYYLGSNAGGKYLSKTVANEEVIRFALFSLESHSVKDVQMIMCALSIIDLALDFVPGIRQFIKELNGKINIEKMIYEYKDNTNISLLAQNIINKLSNY